MLSKELKINAVIIVLLLSAFIGISEAMLKFLCFRLPFATITKMYNGSFFITDFDEGRYWNYIKEDTVDRKTSGYVRFLANNNNNWVLNLEVTFKTTFDNRCNLEREKLFGIGTMSSGEKLVHVYGKVDRESVSKWSAVKFEASNELTKFSSVFDQLLSIKTIDTSKRIKAILNFPLKGLLVIQDQNLIYIYCENGWKTITDNVTNDVIIFENDYKINFGQIFGGYVDQDTNELYLFEGQLTSDNSIVRKFVHKCDIKAENSGKPSKFKLVCEKIILTQYCESLSTTNETGVTNYIQYGLIAAAIILVILFIVLLIVLCLWCRAKSYKKEKENPIVPIEKRPLALNRERVLGDKKTKPKGIARNRTTDFHKKN